MRYKDNYGVVDLKKKSFSIKYRVLVWVFALLLPSMLLLSVFTVLQVVRTYEQLTTSERTNLNLIISQLERETVDVEGYLYDLALKNRVFRSMADRQSETQLYSSAYEVLSSDNLFQTNGGLSFLLLYSEENDYYSVRDNGLEYLSLTERVRLHQAVERRFQRFFFERNGQLRNWFPVEIAERWFLCRIVYYQGIYCAGLFDL